MAHLHVAYLAREILAGNPVAQQPMPTKGEFVQEHGLGRIVACAASQAIARKVLIFARPGFCFALPKPSRGAAFTAVGSISAILRHGADKSEAALPNRITCASHQVSGTFLDLST